uniref:Uncharacterized protein n=1 Tax=Percolomonas cosmopolitus TaxID=63605 RepID=A0A7S1KP32_9EUKA
MSSPQQLESDSRCPPVHSKKRKRAHSDAQGRNAPTQNSPFRENLPSRQLESAAATRVPSDPFLKTCAYSLPSCSSCQNEDALQKWHADAERQNQMMTPGCQEERMPLRGFEQFPPVEESRINSSTTRTRESSSGQNNGDLQISEPSESDFSANECLLELTENEPCEQMTVVNNQHCKQSVLPNARGEALFETQGNSSTMASGTVIHSSPTSTLCRSCSTQTDEHHHHCTAGHYLFRSATSQHPFGSWVHDSHCASTNNGMQDSLEDASSLQSATSDPEEEEMTFELGETTLEILHSDTVLDHPPPPQQQQENEPTNDVAMLNKIWRRFHSVPDEMSECRSAVVS